MTSKHKVIAVATEADDIKAEFIYRVHGGGGLFTRSAMKSNRRGGAAAWRAGTKHEKSNTHAAPPVTTETSKQT